jgi:hypothetical protein
MVDSGIKDPGRVVVVTEGVVVLLSHRGRCHPKTT